MPSLPQYPQCEFPSHHPPVDVSMVQTEEKPCVYLPDRLEHSRAFWADGMSSEVYQAFMDAGFRRSGKVVYQPICRGCRACQSLRVLANEFQPNKSQRRCAKRNADLQISAATLQASDEKFAMYERYVAQWHGTPKKSQREEFESFLYASPVDTIECCYRDGAGKLLAVGICDICTTSLSSVYFYFDPDESARGLGTFGALMEIQIARQLRLPYYYLGFWVSGCGNMEYKATFKPNEVLRAEGEWEKS